MNRSGGGYPCGSICEASALNSNMRGSPGSPGSQQGGSSSIQEAIEGLGMLGTVEDPLEDIGIVRPDAAADLDFSTSQMMDTSQYGEYGAAAGVPDNEEYNAALGQDSQMSVFDPEELNLTMAPATNNFDARRAQILNAVTKKLEDMENEENAMLTNTLETYQAGLKEAVNQAMNRSK